MEDTIFNTGFCLFSVTGFNPIKGLEENIFKKLGYPPRNNVV